MNVVGQEYNWGVPKKYFMRTNNHTARTVGADVRALLVIIKLDTAKKIAHKARSYMDAYIHLRLYYLGFGFFILGFPLF